MKKIFSLQCPMPELDFDVITLGHGSGGRLTNRLLDHGVFKLFDNELLQERHDGAVFNLAGKLAFSTDSFVVSPLFFPGGNIGELAVNGTINDLAMCGALPKFMSLGLIIEEGFKVDELWEILAAIKICCQEAGVLVVTGDTKVVERGKGDGIFINTSGIGVVNHKADLSIRRVEPGDLVLLSGPVASHGMAIMSKREGFSFESDILSDTYPLHQMSLALIETFGSEIKLMRDPTRGGLATVLNEIAQQRKLGISLTEADIPVNNQVAAACEMLGLDPLYVANEGIFMAIISPTIAEKAIALIKEFERGENASIIGGVIQENPGKVFIKSNLGGKRVLGMLAGEQLPRIC